MVSSEVLRASNLFLTARVKSLVKDLSAVTYCQSTCCMGFNLARLETLRLKHTVVETIRWLEPTVAKVLYA